LAGLDVREALPDEVLDVVFEEQHWNVARLSRPKSRGHRHVCRREQEIGDAQVDVALRERLTHFAAKRAHAPLPEIDGVVREPRARYRGCKGRTAALGYRVRDRHDALAARELLLQPFGIVP